MGREPKVVTTAPLPDSSKEQASDAPAIPRATYSADEYNWSGFSCPYCGASNFVSCWGGHSACDGSSSLRNGQNFTNASVVMRGLSRARSKQSRASVYPLLRRLVHRHRLHQIIYSPPTERSRAQVKRRFASEVTSMSVLPRENAPRAVPCAKRSHSMFALMRQDSSRPWPRHRPYRRRNCSRGPMFIGGQEARRGQLRPRHAGRRRRQSVHAARLVHQHSCGRRRSTGAVSPSTKSLTPSKVTSISAVAFTPPDQVADISPWSRLPSRGQSRRIKQVADTFASPPIASIRPAGQDRREGPRRHIEPALAEVLDAPQARERFPRRTAAALKNCCTTAA